jgi:hypothetical protein
MMVRLYLIHSLLKSTGTRYDDDDNYDDDFDGDDNIQDTNFKR